VIVGDFLALNASVAPTLAHPVRRLRLRLGDREQTLAYPGHVKYLSTVLHVAIARAAASASPGSGSTRASG
jgi:hypothetical protein